MPNVNLVAVLAATVAAMVVGSIYYMPALGGNKMMAYAKAPMIQRSPMQAMGLQVIFSLATMLVLAVFIQAAGARDAISGATIGFYVFVIVVLAAAGKTNFGGRPWGDWLLDAGNWLITFVVAGAVIGALSA